LTTIAAAGWRRSAPPPWLILTASIPALLICLPLAYVVLRSWQAGTANIAADLLRERTLMLLANTVMIAITVTAASALIGTAAAWCVERCDLPGRRWWRIAVSLPLAIPAFVASYAWSSFAAVFASMAGAIVILTLSSYPLVFLPVSAALRHMDPAFEDVSRSLGRGSWGLLRRRVAAGEAGAWRRCAAGAHSYVRGVRRVVAAARADLHHGDL
jgi:iron(III) transport system permease protein